MIRRLLVTLLVVCVGSLLLSYALINHVPFWGRYWINMFWTMPLIWFVMSRPLRRPERSGL